jgi:sulfite reductase (NADPH) hemoprotein beta-component
MARIAVPYGEISSVQLRMLARIAREYDRPDPALLAHAQATQDALQAAQPGLALAPPLRYGYGHFTTRTNCSSTGFPGQGARRDGLLASVHMHGIQTSGNCIRNITCDAWRALPRTDRRLPPVCRDPRQWSTLHPEFAFLPRKFKIAFNGAEEDRAATGWYDIGLQARKNAAGEWAYGAGGRRHGPHAGHRLGARLPALAQLLNYIEAIVRVYNSYGRRDNKWKARIKILVKARARASSTRSRKNSGHRRAGRRAAHHHPSGVRARGQPLRGAAAGARQPAQRGRSAGPAVSALAAKRARPPAGRHEAVTLSFKRVGFAPGDADADSWTRWRNWPSNSAPARRA